MRLKSVHYYVCVLTLLMLAAGSPARAQLDSVAVTNAATFSTQFPLSPGCWATAFGDFASVGLATPVFADAVPFPTTLGGIQVLVDGVAAPMSFVGPTQINFLVPQGTAEGAATVEITLSGGSQYSGMRQIWAVSPGLLSIDPGQPTRPGAILNEDGTLNTEANPAAPGERVVVYGIGADFSELPEDGSPAPTDRLINTATPTIAYISVAEAVVEFSGLAPGLVNAWQINAVVPDQTFIDGQVTFQAEVGGIKTNAVSFWVAR